MPKKEIKKEQLLDAGITLLARKPVLDISMNDIAAEAGVTKPMIYYYFGSKTGFYQHLIAYVEGSLREMLVNSLLPDSSFREVLKSMITLRIKQQRDHPDLSKAVEVLATSKTIGGAESKSRIVPIFSRLQPSFEKAISSGKIRKDADLNLVMALLSSLIDSALHIHGNKFLINSNSNEFAEKLIRLLFDGIGTGKGSLL